MEPAGRIPVENFEEPDVRIPSSLGEEISPNEHADSPFVVVIRLLWKERRRLRKYTLVGLGCALVISLLIRNRYEATVQLMPPDTSSMSGMSALGSLLGGSSGGSLGTGASIGGNLAGGLGELLGGQRPGALFVGVLSCRTIADRIIDRFNLRQVYWRKTYASAREKLGSRRTISEDKKTGIIMIRVTDTDKVRAVAMANAYVEELNRLLAHVNTSAASREREFLEQRLVDVHQETQDAAKALSEFSSRNTTFEPEDQGKAMVEATAVLQGQLIAAQSELSGLEQIYTPENVRIRSLKAHVAELASQIDKMGGKNYNGATTLDPNSLYPSLKQLPVLGAQFADLYGRVKIYETVYAMLSSEYELARVEEAKETPSVKVLDAPFLPEKHSFPPRILLTLAGAFLGFLFGSCWIIGLEMWTEMDDNEPHKKLVRDLWADIQPNVHTMSRRLQSIFDKSSINGNGNHPSQ